MNTKTSAVLYFHRRAEIAWWVACGVITLALGEALWIGWLLISLHNCYASG